jgi:thioredoxin-like negative regulator of GroEL
MHDDYPGALARAKREGKPIVIDMWAPWCHTCLSMQHYVLTDASLRPFADRFVWLALDTDRPSSAAALAKFPVTAWPTFFVVSPVDETVQARQVGAASAAQFRELLRQGEQGHLDVAGAAGGLAADDPLRRVRDGDRAALAGDHAAADAAYGEALARAPAAWPRRAEVLVAQIGARHATERWDGCVELGLSAMEATGATASAADFVYHAAACADELPDSDARKRALRERAIARLTALVGDPEAALSVDDRTDAMRITRELQDATGDGAAARRTAELQRALLDRAAAEAPTPLAAMTYNWPRAEVYAYLGRGAELVSPLEASEKALPDEYDPPYRLAWLHLQLGRHDDALAAVQRALPRVYGPRRARALTLLADIQRARGDREAEIAARRQMVAAYEELAEGHAQPAAEAAAREALAGLERKR